MAYYFFKTMADKGRNRLRALTGQKLEDGTPVDPNLNVQSDKTIRTIYPLGTIFVSNKLAPASGYYEAGQIYPIGLRDDEYKDAAHRPTEEMHRAYEVFIGAVGDDFRSEIPEEDEEDACSRTSLLSKMKTNKKLNPPTIKEHGFYVEQDNWYLLLRNIQNQVNTMMIGPTGTGKTELILLACKKLGIKCHVYDMGSMYDPVAGLLGVHRLSKGGISTFDYAKFTQDIQEPGVVLLDELSRAPVTSLNILFPCLDSRRCLPVEIAGGEDVRNIDIHPDCTFIATANVGAEYTGTMSMDRALVGRFFPVELDYMPNAEERKVLVKRCGIPDSAAKLIVDVATNVRSMYCKQELSASLSTRETLMVGELVADGWSLRRAMELVFLPLFEGTMSEGERGIVKKSLMSR